MIRDQDMKSAQRVCRDLRAQAASLQQRYPHLDASDARMLVLRSWGRATLARDAGSRGRRVSLPSTDAIQAEAMRLLSTGEAASWLEAKDAAARRLAGR
jgi:hypothetical protein